MQHKIPKLRCDCEPLDLAEAENAVSVARRSVTTTHGALTFAVYKCVWVPTTAVPTMAMSKHGVLLWNPKFVLKVVRGAGGIKALATIIRHEIWHLLRKHAQRGEALQKLDPTVTHAELNAAADREINDDELASGASFGPDLDAKVLVPSQIGAPDGLTLEEYVYAAREHAKQQQQQRQQQKQDKQEDGDGEDESEGGGGDDGDDNAAGASGGDVDDGDDNADGEDGSGGQGAGDGDADGADGGAAGDGDGAPSSGVATGACGGAAGNPTEAESEIDDALGRADEAMDTMREQVAIAIVEEAKAGRGNYPADVVRWAEAYTKPSKVPWSQLLARHLRGEVSARAGGGSQTYRQVSRRMAGVGYGSGKPVMPGLRQTTPEVHVWVDTSGSIGTEELATACAEVDALLKTVPGRVTVGACDARVHGFAKVRSLDEARALLKGGGGTDFRPLFETSMAAKPAADIIIVLTDGHALLPANAPEGVKVIWVLMGRYHTTTMPWGDCVEVDEA